MRKSSQEIADEFFDKSDVATVDFEIALAALLGTALITYPVEGHALFGQVIAFSLLFLTLIRRIAISSPFASEETILKRTVPLISFASASGILYLIIALLPILPAWLPVSSQVILYSGITLFILITAVVAQELVFHDYLAWWHVKFKQKSELETVFEPVWRDTALIAYWASTARRNRDTYRELGKRLNGGRPDPSDLEFEMTEIARYILSTVLLIGLLYLIPALYSGYIFGGLEGLLLIPAIVAVHDHSAFWYIAYGNPSFEDLRQHILTILVRTTLYVAQVAFLLGHWS